MEKENLRILVIDGNPLDHDIIRTSLERSGVPAVLKFCRSTQKGFGKISHPFDLIVTDHNPPEVNAIRLLQALKELENEIPVILLTHNGALQTVREAFKWGASDYLLKEELEAISLFDVISTVLEKNRSRKESQELHRQLKEEAARDGLTGLRNHRYLLAALGKEYQRAQRYGRPLSLLMIDLDGFKSINDSLGHQKGDRVLIRVAELLAKTVRSVDLIARYGGDEFVILLPETKPKAAVRLAQRILKSIRENPVLEDDKIFPLSASIGLTYYHPSLPGPGALLKEADRALYQAKREGRDRLVVFKPEPGGSDGASLTQLPLAKPSL